MTKIRVITRNLDTNLITDDRIIDHDDREARQWLGKHAFWAMRSKHEVTTRPLSN